MRKKQRISIGREVTCPATTQNLAILLESLGTAPLPRTSIPRPVNPRLHAPRIVGNLRAHMVQVDCINSPLYQLPVVGKKMLGIVSLDKGDEHSKGES